MRLIDADEMMGIIRKHQYHLRDSINSTDYGMFTYGIQHDIDECETINPEDLRQKGKWIGLEYDGYADGNPLYDLWECSNCGNEEKGEDVPDQNPFCRCCGAKMEGE